MKRLFDILLALSLSLALLPVIAAVAVAVRLTSRGPALYWSDRIGKDGRRFRMAKFRSMRTDTPIVATHLLEGRQWLTPIGGVLRSSSLDELPQLWNILRGDMSFVGPRPALFNQDDLMELRRIHHVDRVRPGLTGWAQVNGRDDLTIPAKVALEAEYLEKSSFLFDMRIVAMTIVKVARRSGIAH